jgi:hypothetical protein
VQELQGLAHGTVGPLTAFRQVGAIVAENTDGAPGTCYKGRPALAGARV